MTGPTVAYEHPSKACPLNSSLLGCLIKRILYQPNMRAAARVKPNVPQQFSLKSTLLQFPWLLGELNVISCFCLNRFNYLCCDTY